MSSGSGKKQVAVADEPSPSICAVDTQNPAGGISIQVGQSRISNPTVNIQRKGQQYSIVKAQNAHRPTSDAARLSPYQIRPATLFDSVTITPIRPYVVDTNTKEQSDEMRMKVTGDDASRNGASTSGDQMKYKPPPNAIVARRKSIFFHPVDVPEEQTDTFTRTPDEVTVRPASPMLVTIGTDRMKSKVSVNSTGNTVPMMSDESMAVEPVQQQESVTALPTAVLVSKFTSTRTNITAKPATTSSQDGKVDKPYMDSKVQSLPVQGMVNVRNESFELPVKILPATATMATLNQPQKIVEICKDIEPPPPQLSVLNDVKDANVITNPAVEISSDGTNRASLGEDKSELHGVEQHIEASSQQDKETGGSDGKTFSPETLTPIEKPSREMKLLKDTLSNSKVLAEYMIDASRDGKLRKRRMSSTVGTPVSPIDFPSSIGLRKRTRSRHAVQRNPNDPELDGMEGLATTSYVELSSAGRRMRTVNSEITLRKRHADTQDTYTMTPDEYDLRVTTSTLSTPKLGEAPKVGSDRFCWRCRKSDVDLACGSCIRSFHKSCIRYGFHDGNWSCSECKVQPAGTQHDSTVLHKCLGYALNRLINNDELRKYFDPIDKSVFPTYDSIITYHVDLSEMRNKVHSGGYKSREHFLADINWILHNMLIYSDNTKYIKAARIMVKVGKEEMLEFEFCQECYVNANTMPVHKWFVEVCSKPHLLIWAKLKGFPRWPAKLMAINANNQAYVRFFGEHDRCWCSVKNCYLLSQRDGNRKSMKLMDSINISLAEVKKHIQKIIERFGSFKYSENMQPVEAGRVEEQLRDMIPGAFPQVTVKITRSEGTMVAVASSQKLPLVEKAPDTEMIEGETTAKSAADLPATTVSSPTGGRKRMTRRMSKYQKTVENNSLNEEDHSAEPIPSTSASESNRIDLNDTLSSTTETVSENSESSPIVAEGLKRKGEIGLKPLSLLIRRNSDSWQTEPISKRRKSTVEPKRQDDSPVQGPDRSKKNVEEKEKPAIDGQNVVLDNDVTSNSKTPVTISTSTSTPTSITFAKVTASTPMEKVTTEPKKVPAVAPKAKIAVSVPAGTSTDQTSTANAVTIAVPVQQIRNIRHPPDNAGGVNVSPSVVSPPVAKEKPPVVLPRVLPMIETEIKHEPSSDCESIPMDVETSSTLSGESTQNGNQSSSDPPTKQISAPLASNATPKCSSPSGNSVPVVAHNQRARKSFPAGASNAHMAKRGPSTDQRINIVVGSSSPFPTRPTVPNVVNIHNSPTARSSPMQKVIITDVAHVPSMKADGIHASMKSPFSIVPQQQGTKQPSSLTSPPPMVIVSQTTVPKPANRLSASNGHDLSANSSITLVPKEVNIPSSLSICTAVVRQGDTDFATSTPESDDVILIDEEMPSTSQATSVDGGTSTVSHQKLPPLQSKPRNIQRQRVNGLPLDNLTSQLLDDFAAQASEQIRTMLEDALADMSQKGSALAKVKVLELQLARHKQQQDECLQQMEMLKKEHEHKLAHMRESMEQEKSRALTEQRQQLLREKERAVISAKTNQWCKKCFNEAHFYCCWNTAYCNQACQMKDWPEHHLSCAQSVTASQGRSSKGPSGRNVTPMSPSPVHVPTSTEGNVNSRKRTQGVSSTVCPTARVTEVISYSTALAHPSQSPLMSSSVPTICSTPTRFISNGSPGGNVQRQPKDAASTAKVPIIHAVHGRDNIPVNFHPEYTNQNGGMTIVSTPPSSANVATYTRIHPHQLQLHTQQLQHQQQQPQTKRVIARSLPTSNSHSNNGDASSSKGGILPRHANEVSSTATVPFRSINNATSTAQHGTSTMVKPTYTLVTAGEDAGSSSVWSQIAAQSSSSSSPSSLRMMTPPAGVQPMPGTDSISGSNGTGMICVPTQSNAVSFGQQQTQQVRQPR